MEQPQTQPVKYAEHLKEGVPPIIAGVGTFSDFNEGEYELTKKIKGGASAEHVNYDGSPENNEHQKKDKMYVISDLNGRNKFSENYHNCLGTVVAGNEKGTGRPISILSHQNSYLADAEWQEEAQKRFIADMSESLQDLKEKCEEGTVDAAIFGGVYPKSDSEKKNYLKSVEMINRMIERELGFSATVVVTPKLTEDGVNGNDHAYYDNSTRRLFLIRPKISEREGAFPANEAREYLEQPKEL